MIVTRYVCHYHYKRTKSNWALIRDKWAIFPSWVDYWVVKGGLIDREEWVFRSKYTPLINETFYKAGLIEEEYDGTEQVELLDKELPGPEFGDLELDLRLAVYKGTRRTFHMECQSTSDGTILLRMTP